MRNEFRAIVVAAAAFALAGGAIAPARAIPLFAERYRLQCESCHTVIPELNPFGIFFREHGYRLPVPRHGTLGVALRYQLEYEKDPVNARRYTPGGVLLSNADIGAISAFVHYNLGAGGGPSGLYLGYLASYNAHTNALYRAGLFELPVLQSPGQRLDDLQQYGYYGAHVGLNDLTLAAPRWGVQYERTVGVTVVDAIADLGEFKGAPYGGIPIPTGAITSAAAPEFGLFVKSALSQNTTVGGEVMSGSRAIALTGKPAFDDAYTREGLFAQVTRDKLEATAEQWWGQDADADGFGTVIGSSGGYLRVKYYVNPHAYLGVRYDAFANPTIARDWVYYGAFMLLPDTRLLLQNVQSVGGSGHFGGAITVGLPWPPKT